MKCCLRCCFIGFLSAFSTGLTGCISRSTIESNPDVALEPEAATLCAYRWPIVIDDRPGGPIAMPVDVGVHVSTDPTLGARSASALRARIAVETEGDCRGRAAAELHDAQVVMRYAGYPVVFPEGLPVQVISSAATYFTLGISPWVDVYTYAVCVDVSGTDGLQRSGLSEGRIQIEENAWAWATRKEAGEKLVSQILDQLAIEAWHKAWSTQPSVADEAPGCEVAMKAFMERCALYCN